MTISDSNVNDHVRDSGNIVQTVIVIAGLAVAAIVSIVSITNSTMDKGETVANCIVSQSSFSVEENSSKGCIDNGNNAPVFVGIPDDNGDVTEPTTIYTSEQCFDVSSTVITDYNDKLSECSGDIVIPPKINGVLITDYGNGAFRNNNLSTVVIPNTIKNIGPNAFHSNNLVNVKIPSSVIGISNGAFANNNIVDITLPNTIETIGHGAFSDNNIVNIVFPDSIRNIRANAFLDNNIESVIIPMETAVHDDAFDSNVNIIRKQ